ncbi:tyrosine-type recombinase/integrase [Rhodothermus sp. AH-315-K08]|nr:tyrosine-type recombinase/integrase [Rhodothermus sp. AH-315-K08]
MNQTPTNLEFARARRGGVGELRDTLSRPETNLIPVFLTRFDNPRTQRSYKFDLESFFGQKHVSAETAGIITFLHVNDYLAGLLNDGKHPSTVRRRLAAVRGFFDWLDALKLIEENPTKRHLIRRLPKVQAGDSPLVVLTSAQAASLIDAAASAKDSGVRDATLVGVLLHLVLRRSEAAAMDFEHVRPLGAYTILDLPDTKGGRDQFVKVPEHIAESIRAHADHYGIQDGPLWRSMSTSSFGHRLTPHSIYRIVRNTARRAGLPDIGAHTLRHTGCTLAIEAGASLQQVQVHARHRKLETTMTYIHQRDRLKESAADFISLPGGDRKRSS